MLGDSIALLALDDGAWIISIDRGSIAAPVQNLGKGAAPSAVGREAEPKLAQQTGRVLRRDLAR